MTIAGFLSCFVDEMTLYDDIVLTNKIVLQLTSTLQDRTHLTKGIKKLGGMVRRPL